MGTLLQQHRKREREMVGSNVFSIGRESLLDVFSEEQLLSSGVSSESIQRLREDGHQNHRDRSNGYLGVLVLNFLQRQGTVTDSEEYVSAYFLTDSLGMDFIEAMEVVREDEKIVVEKDLGGGRDLYIAVRDSHLLTLNDSVDDLTQLAISYAQTHNPQIREKLALMSQGEVLSRAKVFYVKLGGQVDLEDLVSDANIGLLEAIDGFDPGRRVKFETYLSHKVFSAIMDGVRNFDVLARLDRARLKKMNEFMEDFKGTDGATPSYDQFLNHWIGEGYPKSTFDDFYFTVLNNKGRAISMDLGTNQGGGSDRTDYEANRSVGRSIADQSCKGPLSQVLSQELMDQFEADLKAMPESYRDAIRMYVIEGITMAEVGIAVDLSESRVSQIMTMYVESGSFFVRTKEYLGENKVVHKLHLNGANSGG